MKKVYVDFLCQEVIVEDWCNYVVRNCDGMLHQAQHKPAVSGCDWSPTRGSWSVLRHVSIKLADVRPSVPLVIGHQFELRNGEKVIVRDSKYVTREAGTAGAANWYESGRHSFREYDLIEDLGPMSIVDTWPDEPRPKDVEVL